MMQTRLGWCVKCDVTIALHMCVNVCKEGKRYVYAQVLYMRASITQYNQTQSNQIHVTSIHFNSTQSNPIKLNLIQLNSIQSNTTHPHLYVVHNRNILSISCCGFGDSRWVRGGVSRGVSVLAVSELLVYFSENIDYPNDPHDYAEDRKHREIPEIFLNRYHVHSSSSIEAVVAHE